MKTLKKYAISYIDKDGFIFENDSCEAENLKDAKKEAQFYKKKLAKTHGRIKTVVKNYYK